MARSKDWKAVTPRGVELRLAGADSEEQAFRMVQNRYGEKVAVEATYTEAPDGERDVAEMICDFCGNQPVRWSYDAKQFTMDRNIGTLGKAVTDVSIGGWAACDDCKVTYEGFGIAALILRCCRIQSGRYGVQMASLVPKLRELLTGFEQTRIGEPTTI